MSMSGAFNTAAAGGDVDLMDAVKNGNLDVVKKLLELGADINIPAAPSTPTPMPFTPIPAPAAAAPAAGQSPPPKQKKNPVITKMATERDVAAPQTARFKKKTPPKRQTTL